MARKTYKGKFVPTNPSKYAGDVNNIVYRSGWEKALCHWLDNNPNVLKWSSENVIVPYILPGEEGRPRPRRYFPDFLIEILDRHGKKRILLIEVKPKKEIKAPVATKRKKKSTLLQEQVTYAKNQAKWKAARAWCKRHGAEFVIWTEDQLVEIGVKVAK